MSEDKITVTVEHGERVIAQDGTVYELQARDGSLQWVEVGGGFASWWVGGLVDVLVEAGWYFPPDPAL